MTSKLKNFIEENIDIIEQNNMDEIGNLFQKCDTLKMKIDLAKIFKHANIPYPESIDIDISRDKKLKKELPSRVETIKSEFIAISRNHGINTITSDHPYEIVIRSDIVTAILQISYDDTYIWRLRIRISKLVGNKSFTHSAKHYYDRSTESYDVLSLWEEAAEGVI